MALREARSSTAGFSTSVAVRSWVDSDISGELEEQGDPSRKCVSPKRKNGNGVSPHAPFWMSEYVGCVPERLHLFLLESCRGQHVEDAIKTPSLFVVVVYEVGV